MRVAIVSDTHVPGRESTVPEWVREEVRAADHTLHAGDWDAPETLGLFEDLTGGALTGVQGNVDPPTIDLPRVGTVTLGGVAFVVTHGNGLRPDYRQSLADRARAHGDGDAPVTAGVGGHTHEYLDDVVEGVRVLNPGSASGARPARTATMMRATCTEGTLSVKRIDGR
jgi:putative phosphoesterase